MHVRHSLLGNSLFVLIGAALPAATVIAQAGDDNHIRSKAAAINGLGTAAPNALDVSQQPGWHAYWFTRDGVRYLQVNDTYGRARMAVGLVNGVAFALPVGSDAVSFVPAITTGVVVYRDANLIVAAQSDVSGVVSWQVISN